MSWVYDARKRVHPRLRRWAPVFSDLHTDW